MSKFSVGDRVLAFAPHLRVSGSPGTVTWVSEKLDAAIAVRMDNENLGTETLHPKQCRRLVKKKRGREWYINIYPGSEGFAYPNKKRADISASSNRLECIRVVEAKEKK